MRKSLLHILLAAALVPMAGTNAADAQNITGYRYWFNDNAAAATTVDLAATPVADANLTLNSASLPPGPHLATIQFRDADGHWGAPWTSLFEQRGSTVNAIEYWFNDDAASAETVPVAPAVAPLITTPLAAATLPTGLHTVTVRTIDARGGHSVPFTTGFARTGGMINGYEYWIDDAIDDRTSGTLGPLGAVDLITSLPVPSTEGSHLFTIRFRAGNGEGEDWSVPLSSAFDFLIGIDEIPGVSNYLLFPNPVSDQLSLRVDASAAKNLHVEVLDASGRTVLRLGTWSVVGTSYQSWDASMLVRGSYLLHIANGEQTLQIPFVKQ